jgi:tetratricopeptide (TPR) repeat protein
VLIRLDQLDEAAAELDDALAVTEAHHDRFGAALVRRTLGELDQAAGNLTRAAERLDASTDIWRALGLPLWVARTLRDRGAVHSLSGNYEAAHDAWSEAEAVFAATGAREQGEMPHWRPHTDADASATDQVSKRASQSTTIKHRPLSCPVWTVGQRGVRPER